MMKHYLAPSIWTGRIDQPEDIRWHQQVQIIDLERDTLPQTGRRIAFIGFACDEGVRRNKGRVGAAAGPAALRKAMASYASHFEPGTQLLDVGTIKCWDANLEAAQAELSACIARLLVQGIMPVVLGGGHETAYASYTGLRQAVGSDKNIGIINFDAHFDLRLPRESSNSGTPFYQIAADCKTQKSTFNYFVLGINATGNTTSLFQRADELGVNYVTNDELIETPKNVIKKRLEQFIAEQDYIYLTIDLDGFDAAYAPGVSAAASFGLFPHQTYSWIQSIKQSQKLALFDICELNPIYDIDNRTAKLGAALIARLLV